MSAIIADGTVATKGSRVSYTNSAGWTADGTVVSVGSEMGEIVLDIEIDEPRGTRREYWGYADQFTSAARALPLAA